MDTAEIRAAIKKIITNVTGIPSDAIGDSASFRDELDLDSLSLLEIAVDVDFEFKLGLPEEQLQGLRNVDEAVQLVQNQLAAKMEQQAQVA